ncbi:EAL domain-containing protein [Comamonas testosteroni]|uniref:EAL domain-containing protein n=1 Tax=Comamonas testosteroni TaxID=285 RepID=UPI0025D420E9|nr:EAL domain-containing protein [Comamonas testosteroni]MEB5967159.1 EAL domain-containing protein [Comamonas testosteroni]
MSIFPVIDKAALVPCSKCHDRGPLSFEFSMAFQPIVDMSRNAVFAYEALVRGTDGCGAARILGQVNDGNRYQFDQACRVKAIELAARLGISSHVSINFLPNAVYEPSACIRKTLEAAREHHFPARQIIFEITENERIVDKEHLKRIMNEYRRRGFKTAIDDFGAGYSGLNLLAEFQPDIIKLDMELVRNIDCSPVRQAIVQGIIGVCKVLGIEIIAEGVESEAEFLALRSMGVHLFQGYFFAKPAFEELPAINGFSSSALAP